MASPKKSSTLNVETISSRELLQKYFSSSDQNENLKQQQQQSTYYVDQDGQYYYKPASQCEEALELLEPLVDTKVVGSVQQVHIDGGTLNIVQTEGVNYFMVLPDPQSGAMRVTDEDPASSSVTVYEFDDKEDSAEEQDDFVFMGRTYKTHKRRRLGHYKCEVCSYTSPRKYLLQRHMRRHSDQRPFLCEVCERGFKTPVSLNNHLNTHKGLKPHLCTYCSSAFTTSGELVRHVRYRHTHDKPHKCTECQYASVELSKLRRHMRCHTGERPYQCPQCTYASSDTFKLKRHLRTHTGEKPYKCTECNMTFTQSNSLKTHKLIHNSGEKPTYPCELCPATCGRKTDLRLHIHKLHSTVDPLRCDRCTKVFTDRYSFRTHIKTHVGDKCYKCTLCPYASTTLRHLKCHLLRHTDEKPHVCQHCDQTFRQKQLLKRHENLYHNPEYVPAPPKLKSHKCHECMKQYANKGNLIRHLALHDPDRAVVKTENPLATDETAYFEEEEEEDERDNIEVNTADDTTDKTEELLVVYQVVERGEGGGDHILLVEPEHDVAPRARSLRTPLGSGDGRDTTDFSHNYDTHYFGFEVSE